FAPTGGGRLRCDSTRKSPCPVEPIVLADNERTYLERQVRRQRAARCRSVAGSFFAAPTVYPATWSPPSWASINTPLANGGGDSGKTASRPFGMKPLVLSAPGPGSQPTRPADGTRHSGAPDPELYPPRHYLAGRCA